MATIRSVDFLPEIFQTDANKQFFAATLDQLIQEPKFKKTQGFIGRTVGPGVNPNDRYVVEPNKTRADYQLEPGVVSLRPDTDVVRDVITYPGMNDAVGFQGGNSGRPDRLYNSEYYSWDPFVDFDSFVNFSQYFWLPNGPDVVDVASVGVATQANFAVTRENGVYTFGGVSGENPTIELVRGGSYTFQVAQNAKETVNYRVRNAGTTAYVIDGLNNPTLTLARGNTYVFNINLLGVFPFWIKTAPTTGRGEAYNSGVSRNGSDTGLVTFVVPEDAPDLLYYTAENQSNMQGQLRIVNSAPGTGPGFWIQAAPGVSGVIPTTPNINSREVFGVVNNGQDLGTVVFNVPYKTSQGFYYNLNSINNVDLITDLKFDQINNRAVNDFVAEYGGIDGITNLNGRTVVFTNPIVSTVAGGWIRTTLFDPLTQGAANNGQLGSYDSIPYDQATEISVDQRYQLWQINYVNFSGTNYIQLSKIQDIATLTKFTIRYGSEYSNTQWYKNDSGLFDQIPLLTAAQDVLYYQDGTDPEIFGRIQLIDQTESETLFVNDILGQSSYTSPNGVAFTNGLKVRFTGQVEPAEYESGLGTLTYTATESGTNYITAASDTTNLYVNQQIVFSAPTLGGLVAGATYYVRSFAANGLKFTVSLTPSGPAVSLASGTGFPGTATTISNREYYVSGVGTAIELLPVPDFVVPESYAAGVASNVVQTFTITTVPNLDGPGAIYSVDGTNKPVLSFVRGGIYTFDQSDPSNSGHPIAFKDGSGVLYTSGVVTTGTPGSAGAQTVITVANNAPDSLRYFCTVHGNNMGNIIAVVSSSLATSTPDYITISRASRDRNAWSRSNRWFHIDVINATARYNNTPAALDNNNRAKRPVIQFRPGIRLWNMGTQGKQSVDIIDFVESDAFSNINGTTGYTVNGYALTEGSRVIFAADTDADVRNKIYQVSFIVPDSVDAENQPIINLTVATDGAVLVDQSVVALAGTTTAGKTYWFDGISWTLAQQKTGIQQAPLYDVYDPAGVSFGNNIKYPSTTFAGSKLFSYAVGDTNILDPVLQFPLQYLNIDNIGDIVFENNLYKDTFLYVEDNASVTTRLDTGSVQEYQTRTEFEKLIGWQTAAVTSQVYQQFKFNYTGATLKLDVAVIPQTSIAVPVIKIYVGSVFQDDNTYSYQTTADSTVITLNKTYALDDVIEVLVLSEQTSSVAFYQVPVNLESNPLNENSELFTLGTVRSHYQSICENTPGLTGTINGANNLRDLGNIVPYGLVILQQSAPLTLAGYFFRSEEYNIFSALQYNSREYIKFKAQMLDSVLSQNIGFRSTAQVLDTAIQDVTLGKIDSQPFYWSDMIPAGITVASNSYQVGFVTGNTFDTVQIYNYVSANYLGLLVYKNSQLLTRGVDYVVATDGPRLTITAALAIGDTVTIDEYATTYGSFVPNTPTKLGLYPAYQPGVVLQTTSNGVIQATQGHDGSTTPLFGDIRDQVLLEFETRIYNNLKLDGNPVPLIIDEVLPGQFRDTGYSFQEINSILGQDFLSYCGWNKLDYTVQQYTAGNSFTWNYSSAQNKLDNKNMLGAWRGIYRYTYDTQQPEYTPWEMLGLSIRPTWWNERYGPAPYTRDNLVLWDDIAAGYVADPLAPYFAKNYARPGLLDVLPTGSEGELLSPAESIMGTFNETQFQKSWAVGDGGPVEASWWNSSSYPFAVMRVLALTRPAKFFSLFADRDLYRYNEDFQQYLYNNRFRLDANGIEIYGNGVSKASYIDWIVDYNRLTGMDATDNLAADLKSLDVRLCYRMASFSDKQYIKLYTEKSSPNSQNTSLLIPDESYDILLYKNQPFDRVTYSSVTIQRTQNGGFAVNGYSVVQPYFNILQSRATGRLQTYTNGGVTIRVPTFYTDTVVQVPYGFVFNSVTSVADFLLSYGQFLERQGLNFSDIANGYVLDWPRMVNEFLYWSQQGWSTDAIINLNPLASGLTVTKPQAIVNSVQTQTAENSILTQNSQEFPVRNLNIVRLGNTFTMQSLNSDAISYADLSYTTYEHMIVLSNQSVFGDLIYNPTTGARQSRLNMIALTSTDWNGSVDAPGFILNQDNVEEWTGLRTYSKGEIVKYKNVFWSALTIVQPSTTFNFGSWTQSDYAQSEFGLLPNLSNKADQLTNSYNINTANIDSDNDLLSYGLIGFRPRQYMAALNLDDVSQVNVYRQFLGSKGTALSAELFKGANFGKEAADYDIFENWAVQRAVYGANANRSFFELRLNRALLNANPSLVQVVLPQQATEADQAILLSNVWRQSYRLTSPDILTTTTTLPTDIALPTAGYVNLNDADITVFDINETDSLSENIDRIQVGTTIWVAKTNEYDWNIYRAESVPGTIDHVCDNLNGTSRVIFSKQHNLTAGDKLIIKFFDAEVDGVYQVVSVPNLTTVNIFFQFSGDRTVVNAQGLGFTLQTMRVAQASDVANLPFANDIRSGARVWVDNNGMGAWSVLEKQQVFESTFKLNATPNYSDSAYGSSISQTQNRLATLVGSPNYQLPLGVTLWSAQTSYTLGQFVYLDNSGIYTVYEVTTVLPDTTQTPDELVIDGFYQIVSLGDTDWNQIAGTTGVTYLEGSTFTVTATGSGTGTAQFVFADQVPAGILPTDTDFWDEWTPEGSEWAVQRGGVYVYVSTAEPVYSQVSPLGTESAVLSLEVLDTVSGEFACRGYGNAVDFGNQTWAVAGASRSLGPAIGGSPGAENNGYATVIFRDPTLGQPASIPYTQWQLLTQPGTTPTVSAGPGEFGHSVVLSQDEYWMYIGAPGLNQVHAYGRIDWQNQFVRARGNGVTTTYSIAEQIQIDADTQLRVSVAGRILTLDVDYTVDLALPTVTFATAPGLTTADNFEIGSVYTILTLGTTDWNVVAGTVGVVYAVGDVVTAVAVGTGSGTAFIDVLIDIQRIFVQSYAAPVSSTLNLGSTFFTATDIESFTVRVGGILFRPSIDYTFDTGTKTLTFVTAPGADAEVVINAQGYFKYVGSITTTGLTAGARFGQSVSCTTDGRQLLVGTPNQTVNGQIQAGAVYVFDRNVQKFIYTSDVSTSSISVLGAVTEPVAVYVNNTRLINAAQGINGADGTFTVNEPVAGQFEVIIEDPLNTGDVVEIETNQFALVQMIEQNSVAEFCNFGSTVDLCSFNCSLYVGEPQSSAQIFKGGIVERSVNQSRTYGSITSLNTYQNIQDPLADYSPSFVPGMYKDTGKINNRTQYLFVGALTTDHTLRVNNIDVAVPAAPNNTIIGLRDAINATVPNVLATVSGVESGYLTLSVKNNAAAAEGNKLQVAPGSEGTAFTALDFETFVWTQNITNPYPIAFAGFGSSLSIDTSAVNLVVGAPKGTLYIEIEFDDGTTIFDIGSTVFFRNIVQSGAVYTFDFLPSSTQTVSNPGKFVFGTQLFTDDVNTFANYGQAVDYTSGVLMIGAPDANPGSSSDTNYGGVFVYDNASRAPVWQATVIQQPVVDIRLLNSVFLYNQITSATTEFLDFIDPLQGKILGAARQNIDYIGAVDPAAYNSGPNNVRGTTWGANYVGKVWWDTSTVRFIDPNQDNIVYASRRWSQVFPGSSVDVYQWIESAVPPANYTGEGTVFSSLSYTINSKLTPDGTFVTTYYFWVRGITSTSTQLNKTLPVSTVANYIENPRASGIPYLAPINASTVALYNAGDFIEASDTVLHIEFDRELTTDNVHVEYELIAQDRADGFLSNNLYRKLQDSFCGVDTFGNQVPDRNLSPAEQYGVQFRPRQSMFVDRFEALRNYLTRANTVLRQYTISESRIFNLLNSSEPELPQTQQVDGDTIINWNLRVANLEILGFQNIDTVPLGYKYLVQTDSNNRGLWTIYTVQLSQTQANTPELVLTRVQNFNTPDYWKYIDWYRPGYNASSKIITEVSSFSLLGTLSVPTGSSVKVTANAQGKFEIYLRTDLGWERVGLEDGTIEFSAELWDYALGRFGFDIEVFDAQYFDQEPVIETRKIIQAINEELFIDDLAIERNRALVLMFNYVLSEFSAPEWLVKTSLIDVDHKIRDLVPFQNFIRDNQEFVQDYIQEVKPYHVQIREFNLKYTGFNDFLGDLTDFDLPAYFNTQLAIPEYTSPVLLPYELGTSFNSLLTTESDLPATSTVWATWPYNTWFQNYLLNLVEVQMVNNGSGYNEPPEVVFVGTAVQPAQGRAVINSLGRVTGVVITTPGLGYRATPEIVFSGGNGINARAYAVMNGAAAAQNYSDQMVPADTEYYSPVRTFRTTMKFDRYQYVPGLTEWTANTVYQNGDLVRYDNRVWQATSAVSTVVSSPTFDLENWQLVNSGTYNNGVGLSGVDRTMGLYVAGVNSPGLELPLLIDGVEYPGVQVYGQYFSGNPVTLDTALDAVYQSSFIDTNLGNRFSDINVDGGKFVGVYEGHAPEELVNGSEFDTLDFKVFTRPGSDWSFDGHGFNIGTIRYTYEPSIAAEYAWTGIVANPIQVLVSNLTTGLDLARDINYTINWNTQTVTIISNVSSGDVIDISVYEAGGASQLYRANYSGADANNSVIIPVNNTEIFDVAVFVNGQLSQSVTWQPYATAEIWSIFNSYDQLDVVVNAGVYYRALQSVPVGTNIDNLIYWFEFVPTLETEVTFGQTFDFDDGISLLAYGLTYVDAARMISGREYTISTSGNTDWSVLGAADTNVGTTFVRNNVALTNYGTGIATTVYDWSAPQVQTVVADNNFVLTKTITAINSLEGTNPANMIVTRNGLRLEPPEGIEWFGDSSTVSFGLPQRGNYQQNIIDPVSDILVWVDGEPQTQSLGAFVGDFSVTNWDGSNTPGRQVVFTTAPAAGARILISVNTVADYIIAGNQVQISSVVNLNDVFAITTWNDTAQQNILTQVFKGPVVSGVVIQEPYDSTDFDAAVINNTPGSYDFATGVAVANNQFNLQRTDIVASRLWVTLDGFRLFEGADFTVQNGFLILSAGVIGPTQVLAATQFTNNVVPEEMGFRIFQDMRGVQATYRITRSTTTQLSAAVSATADEIPVINAAALSEPNLELGIFGVAIVDGERIMYRNRNLANNTISGLLRGTAGTAAAPHALNAVVTDLGQGNLLGSQFQDRLVSNTSLADGSTVIYSAPNIVIVNADSSVDINAVEVYVAGTRQSQYIEIAPVVMDNEIPVFQYNIGEKYVIVALGDTDWNSIAGTQGIVYQLGDTFTAAVPVATISTGAAYHVETQYRWTVDQIDPLSIEFVINFSSDQPLAAPPSGVEVTILVRRGVSWYQPGADTASDGIALQETQTEAARFLRGF